MLAGVRFSDHPECVDPEIGSFARVFNDGFPHTDVRTRHLRPVVLHLLDTNHGEALTKKRSWLCADAFVREVVPLVAPEFAAVLRALPPIDSFSKLTSVTNLMRGPMYGGLRERILLAKNPGNVASLIHVFANYAPLPTREELYAIGANILMRMCGAGDDVPDAPPVRALVAEPRREKLELEQAKFLLGEATTWRPAPPEALKHR